MQKFYAHISRGAIKINWDDSCISSSMKECPRKTFNGINNLLNLRRPKFSWSWTLVSFIAILTLAFILESSTVSSLPTRTKSRKDPHHMQSHQNNHQHHQHHNHRPSKHSSKQKVAEMVEPLPGDSSGSLSIVTPLDVLRQNMLLEIHRTKIRHAKNKVVEGNRIFLEKIGR